MSKPFYKKALPKNFAEKYTKAYFYGLALLFTVCGMALIGKFWTIEAFTLSQLTGIFIVLAVGYILLWFNQIRRRENF